MMMLIVEVIEILIMGARCNGMIDSFVDDFFVTDDGDSMYIDLYGVYSLVNG